jgi:hypothetical protein
LAGSVGTIREGLVFQKVPKRLSNWPNKNANPHG